MEETSNKILLNRIMYDEHLENFSEHDMLRKDELEQEVTHSNPRFVWWHTLCQAYPVLSSWPLRPPA